MATNEYVWVRGGGQPKFYWYLVALLEKGFFVKLGIVFIIIQILKLIRYLCLVLFLGLRVKVIE
jgi:hypothetical protein